MGSLDTWHAHVVTIHRRKVLVAICSDNCFGVVLRGVKKAQLTNHSSVVLTAIRETIADYDIRQEIIFPPQTRFHLLDHAVPLLYQF